MKRTILVATALLFAVPATVSAHCQVPCGIFDNDNVIQSMQTDLTTIEKASKEIAELSKDPTANAHQLTRWIMTKESHCQDIQEKVLNYFLAQRIKMPKDDAAKEAYLKDITLCHELIVMAMKCKQSTDLANVEKLRKALHSLQDVFGSKE